MGGMPGIVACDADLRRWGPEKVFGVSYPELVGHQEPMPNLNRFNTSPCICDVEIINIGK